MMDPEIAAAAAALPTDYLRDPRRLRDTFADLPETFFAHRDGSVRVDDRTVEGVAVRVYTPVEARTGECAGVCWIHGGAWCFGNPDIDDWFCHALAKQIGAVVVSVDYRLAPEHRYPAAADDCWTVVRWMAADTGVLGIDARRIAVAGGSAGANLAAAMTLRARSSADVTLAYQLLLVPVLDDRCAAPSVIENWDAPVVAGRDLPVAWRHYLGDRVDVPADAAPARADALTGLPPAFVLTASLDPLRDEGIEYALRLQRAGVPVELLVVPDVPHGFDFLAPQASVSRRVREYYFAALGAALGRTGTNR